MKLSPLILLLFLFSSCATTVEQKDSSTTDVVQVEYPEVYELANIILALTEYGQADKWEVRKDFNYYTEMMDYFRPYIEHPLLDSVNYSRKRWKEYLSFRTDFYAFEFNKAGQLERTNDFQAFEITSFDKHLPLIQDFAEQSKFRAFFKNNKAYYDQVVNGYKKEYMLAEMKSFLSKEFEDFFVDTRYNVVISPFVYAQNLHRNIDSNWVADFPSISKSIAEGKGTMGMIEKSTEVHTLFTEMDHGYVNPTSSRYPIKEQFQESKWDKESGYSGSGDAVFNEYMTWAVFDLFNQKYFPEIAEGVNLGWHFQNERRGFLYSNFFAKKLVDLYNKNKGEKKIAALYPAILDWCQSVQGSLSKPQLLAPKDSIIIQKSKNLYEFEFSEPLQPLKQFHVLIETNTKVLDTILINQEHDLQWKAEDTKVSFHLETPDLPVTYITFNLWGVSIPLYSRKGILLKNNSYIKVVKENADSPK